MKVLVISGTILPLSSDRLQMSPSGAAPLFLEKLEKNEDISGVLGVATSTYTAFHDPAIPMIIPLTSRC